ncbi:Protein of unknown function DUF2283 [Ferroglobus placidus DSM 10642]|uniref:DUF2283 domain-containing protein n=1 Tax=Ferroglobus placidus (strain DSM 10642 / AEDII12DO) TaxID=589924 RepID=D3S1Y6_FERPA|nr:DUF2283 domain-containing protein [Ferroglobus placidus]ADC64443.1 Protein of unknown function DUF2283 [Ferroglobus placidus DSM 10642]
MMVKYDREADILYLKFSDTKPVDSDMLNDDVVVSFDENGEIVGMEIWRAKELILPAFLQYLKEMREVVKR